MLPGSILAIVNSGLRNSVSVPENEAVYNRLYALYRQMHDAFGGVNRSADLSGVMKELIRIREEQTKA